MNGRGTTGRARLAIATLVAAMLTFALLLAPRPARAGQPCEERAPAATAVLRGLQLAERVERARDHSGAEVVRLARARPAQGP